MALSSALLSQNMLETLRSKIKSKFPEAKSMPFQVAMTDAISAGIVASVQTANGTGIIVNGAVLPPPVMGILGLEANIMTQAAISYYLGRVGSVGSVLPDILEAIFTSIISHLALTDVIPVSGFGGPITSIFNVTEDVTFMNIFNNLPPDTKAQISQSEYGDIFFKAIAHGFTVNITSSGVTPPLMFDTSGPKGIPVVKFQ